MLTRRGIEYDLKNSPYTLHYENMTLYFSSSFHMSKFVKEYKQHRKKIAESLSNRFGLFITADIIADIILYKRVETRGFLIETGGINVCHPKVILNGEILTDNSFQTP